MSHDQRRATDATRAAAVSTEDESGERKSALDLSIPQLLAGALAAASAAVAASWLGVAGTVLGAVVASVVVSVSSALYKHSLEKSHQVIKETLPVLPVPRVVRIGGATEAGQAADETAQSSETLKMAPVVSSTQTRAVAPTSSRRIRWGAVAVTSLIILVAGFGVLTVFETVIGKTAASITGSNNGDGTTVGRLVNPRGDSGNADKDDPADDKPADDNDDPTAPASGGDTTDEAPTTEPATTEVPTTEAPTTEAPTTEVPTTEPVESDPPTTVSTQGTPQPTD